MILLVDAGNSRLKWGLWHDGAWVEQGALAATDVAGLAPVLARGRPSWAGVACVAGTEVRAGLGACLAGLATVWLKPSAHALGIVNRYQPPESLGADRYAALVACQARRWGPCVLVSAGTALTVDALAVDPATGEGEFLGGMIVPGLHLMRRALAEGTAGVAAPTGDWQPFPRSTGAAVSTGILTALAGTVEAMRVRLAGHCRAPVPVVVGGGDGGLVAARLSGPARIEENLVLEGLLCLARDRGVTGA